MVSPDQTSAGHSAIFFMDGAQVSRQMKVPDFEAFLDGYVGLSDLADTDVHAALVELDSELYVEALVLFRIWFDEEGRADNRWNLPIERLVRQGAKGPDLGAGPIRLVCRSLCPEPRFVKHMWDPDMRPGSNTFQAIRKAVAANSLKFPRVARADDIPVLAVQPKAPTEQDIDRVRIARILREQRLRIKTLSNVPADTKAKLERQHQQELQAERDKYLQLQQEYERQRATSEQLKDRLAERNEQYLEMQRSLQTVQAQLEEAQDHADRNAKAEVALLREQLARKQRELTLRDDQLAALEKENHELRHRPPVEDSITGHLQAKTVFLVAYHPGVGHLTLPYDDLDRYFASPLTYASNHAGLSEAVYREWLQHYENPVCGHQEPNGEVCQHPIMRISQPSAFTPGVNDRCEDHRVSQDAAAANGPAPQTTD
ncbi:DNA repair protein [Marinobacter sp. X15-166B]|uniref:DNA repair protein n=1 Tax=Marinobacter sp. X15-166B TaxID=1897620 RepID=UPI00085BD1B8|nr:DNA repair protein [Marinobacter sp. X15-166B]OEY66968.1 DNA repair protein [Marinobacter sp. X15-166B]